MHQDVTEIPEIPPSPRQLSVDLYSLIDVGDFLSLYGSSGEELSLYEYPLMSEQLPIPEQLSIHLYPLEAALLIRKSPEPVLQESSLQNLEPTSETSPLPHRLHINLYPLPEVGRRNANILDGVGDTLELSPSPQHVSINPYPLLPNIINTQSSRTSSIETLSDVPPSPTHISIDLHSRLTATSVSADTPVPIFRVVEPAHQNLTESTLLTSTSLVDILPIEDEEDWLKDEEIHFLDGSNALSSVKLADKPEPLYPARLEQLAGHIGHSISLPSAFRRFLWSILNPDSDIPIHTVPLDECPSFTSRIQVYHSATAYYSGKGDHRGESETYHERIRSVPSQGTSLPRRDAIFIQMNPDQTEMAIARVQLFFAFKFRAKQYSCAFVQWFEYLEPDPSGLWTAKLELLDDQPSMAVIELDRVVRRAHLLPNFKTALPPLRDIPQPSNISQSLSLNPYVDYHTYRFID
ncbi:hypothetical protein CPB83DRAFT_817335 [Crepidotus variabilis]|uniref:Uncharacterized protein n=1 Tax=Crepidotus variabilis TaxID=179855 RepID=A0A9P6EC38_9AGAR|nr:hypothetical protein CPB83DRAFT_817335 [Crepidotus variabilis]